MNRYMTPLKFPDPTAWMVADSLKYLLPILDTVLWSDQEYRYGILQMKRWERRRLEKLRKRNAAAIRASAARNLRVVSGIIDRHGWLGVQDIGLKASMTMFMVLQHADPATQEKYYPMLEEAFHRKKLLPSQYAMITDRIELRHKRPQRYGSQLQAVRGDTTYLWPLLQPDSVDAWRKSIGMMESLQQYLRQFGVRWDLEAYKKSLPELDRKFGVIRDKPLGN
ncbi:MAG TPA: DUF6624 domain-containing protein [Flavisolibacter sp.]